MTADEKHRHRFRDRNEEIYRRFHGGESAVLLAREYGIARSRLYQILDLVSRQGTSVRVLRRK